MPKAKPSSVVVHRIELQETEREALQTLVVGHTVRGVVLPAAIVGGVIAATYIGYKSAKAFFNWGNDAIDDFQQLVESETGMPFWEPIVGKKTYEDSSGNTYTNPFAGWPIAGPLFGAGINFGIASNPFD